MIFLDIILEYSRNYTKKSMILKETTSLFFTRYGAGKKRKWPSTRKKFLESRAGLQVFQKVLENAIGHWVINPMGKTRIIIIFC